MSIFSSIGHALSTGWHDVFGGGNSGSATTTTTTQRPLQRPAAANNNQARTPDVMAVLQKPANSPPTLTNPAAEALQKAQPSPTTQTTTQAPPPPKTGFWQSVGHQISRGAHDVGNVGEAAAGIGAGAAAATLRAGEGFVKGTVEIPKIAVDAGIGAGNLLNKAIGAPQQHPEFQKTVDHLTDKVTKPIDYLAKNTDLIPGMFNHSDGTPTITGKYAATLYKPAQVAANVATVIPATESLASKIPVVGSKLSKVSDFVNAQKATPTVQKVTQLFKPNATEDAVSEGAATAEGAEVAEGVSSANPNQAADAIEQTTPKISTAPAGEPVPGTTPLTNPTGATAPTSDTAASIREPVKAPTLTPPDVAPPAPTGPVEAPIDNTPAYIRKAEQTKVDAQARQTAEANAGNLGAEATPLDRPTFQHNQDVQAVINDGEQQLNNFLHDHPAATQAEIEQAQMSIREQVLNKIQDLRNTRAGVGTDAVPPANAAEAVAKGEPVVAATDVNGNPALVSEKAAAQQAEAAGVNPNPAPTNPAEVQAAEAAQMPEIDTTTPGQQFNVNGEGQAQPSPRAGETPPLQSDRTAPNAPNIRAGLEKQLGDVVNNLKGVQSEHAVLSNPDVDAAAQRVIATMDDNALLDRYASGAKFTNTADTSQGYAALDRLSELTKSPDPDVAQKAGQAIDNILEASEQGISEAGRQMNYAQTLFDKLPRPAKVAALIRNIDKQREKLELPLVKDDPALTQQVNATVDRYLSLGEDLQSKVAAIEGRAEEIQQAAREGKTTKADIKEARKLQSDRIKAQLDVEKNQGDLAQYYDGLVPGKKFGQQNIGDATRTLMLSSVAGRLNDPITTGANMIHTLINMGGESLIGKGLNAGRMLLGRNPGKYISKGPSLRTVARGSNAMMAKTEGEFKGSVYAGGDLRKALQSGDMGGRTQLSRATNLGLTKTRRFIRAGAEMATNLSGGIKTAELERGAYQEARQLGLKGNDLKAFTAARAASPTRLEEEAGNKLWDEVNNMNDNWLTSGLEKMSGAMTHVPVIGQTMKNLTFPFTRWVGGQAYNMVTDKNAVANVVKFANAWRKGDSQAMVKNVAGLAQNATAALTLGYGLAKAGILTTTDAQGYNDNGLYLHINGRYVPASFLGFFAPSIILGYSTYHGFNDSKDSSVADKILHTTATTLDATWRAVNGNTLTGQDNTTLEALGKWGSRQGGYGAGDVAATVAGQGAGQFVPGIVGDVNAVLNNSTNLNPTHEASLTKVENPNSKSGHATDVPKTALNQFKNRIPGVSQTLPRKAGVAAPDEVDRLIRGGARDTGATIQAAKDKQTKINQSAYNAAHDIPDPAGKYDSKKGESFEGAVAARIANNEYDKAIPALQQKLNMYKGDKNVDPKTVKKLQSHIKELNVTKTYGADGQAVRELYTKTNLTDWRNMGDPESDSYDPETYQKLYDYDTKLARQGVAGNGSADEKNKFTAKKPGKGRSGSSAATRAANLIKDNTVGSTPNLGMVSFGNLSPQKIGTNAAIPTIQQIKPGELIKKRAISVSSVR
jgi:hypothetical protein